MAEHGAPGPQAVPTPAGRQRACPGARICLGAAKPRLTGSFGDRWPGWVVAQPLEGVSASQRALGRRCSGVTVCFVCVCCRRLRGQLGPRAAREGLDVAEAARAALGSTPWVCCSCRLAQIVCGILFAHHTTPSRRPALCSLPTIANIAPTTQRVHTDKTHSHTRATAPQGSLTGTYALQGLGHHPPRPSVAKTAS